MSDVGLQGFRHNKSFLTIIIMCLFIVCAMGTVVCVSKVWVVNLCHVNWFFMCSKLLIFL